MPTAAPPRPSRRALGALVPLALAAPLVFSPTEARAYQECELSGCGTNTPIVYATPIEGISPGIANHRGITLSPTVERVAPAIVPAAQACPDGATIDVHAGELVCRQGATTFSRQGLVGIALTLTIPPVPCDDYTHTPLPACPPRRMTVRIRIEEVGSVETWEVQSPSNVVTYRMVWHELTDSDHLEEELVLGESICPMRRAWMDPWQNPRSAGSQQQRPDDNGWSEETDHLLIIHGETYRADASVDLSGGAAADWFNLGCVGSALAKMRLLGANPIFQPAGVSYRAATLKMLTGRYRGERSYTSQGMPLFYQHLNGKSFYGHPRDPVSSHLESYWLSYGATCISHRRTWLPQTPVFSPPPLAQFSLWMAEARPEGDIDGVFDVLPNQPNFVALYRSAEEKSLLEEMRPMSVPTCGSQPAGAFWVTRPVSHVDHTP